MKREEIAAMAMQAMIANPELTGTELSGRPFDFDSHDSRRALCFKAVQFADQMTNTFESFWAEDDLESGVSDG